MLENKDGEIDLGTLYIDPSSEDDKNLLTEFLEQALNNPEEISSPLLDKDQAELRQVKKLLEKENNESLQKNIFETHAQLRGGN